MNDFAPKPQPGSVIRSLLLALIPLALAGGGLLWLQLRQPDPNPARSGVEKGEPVASQRPEETANAWTLQLPGPLTGEFVGSEACRSCHAEIVDQYAKTGMGRSFAMVSDATPLEARATPEFTAAGRRYRVQTEGAMVAHVEEFVDEVGEPICGQTVPIQYAMGSGLKGRSYLFEHEGALFMSPISWYSAGNRFDLSPGYRPEQGDRFERRITSRCLSCHVGHVKAIRAELDRFESPPFSELAIGCERCHGPGGAHIQYHSGDVSAGADTIVNPRRLPVEQREAVCNQCHLLGAEEILRAGRNDFDFRPGMRLSDIWSLFLEPGTTQDDGTLRAVSQVEQMRDSRCYRRSKGELGCTSCHDPHAQPEPAGRDEYYRARCQTCHADRGCTAGPDLRAERGDSCIACHMPALTDQDIPHVSQSDHSIPRVPRSGQAGPPDSTGLARGPRRQPTLFYDGQALPDPDLQRARGIVAAKRAAESVDEQQLVAAIRMLERVAAANPEDLAPAAAIARCYEVLGKPADAAPLWREILMRDPVNEEALLSMAQMHQRVGQFPEALPFIDSFLKTNDWLSHAHGLRAQVRERMGALPDALKSAQIALERDPTRVSAYRWLEEAYRRSGQAELAEKYRSSRERLERVLAKQNTDSSTGNRSPESSDSRQDATPQVGPPRDSP